MTKVDLSPPSEVHPIALETYKLWHEGGRSMSADALKHLEQGLFAIQDMTELFRAVTTMAASALFIEQQGDPTAKDEILAVVKTQAKRFEAARDEMAVDVQDSAEKLAQHLERLSGTSPAPKTAPKLGATAPKGTISLKNMVPNPALRPPPAKKK